MEREPQDFKPRQPRQTASLRCVGHWLDGSSATVLITNMSYDGCHIWTDHDLCAGETIDLTLPARGKIHAQIRWAKGGRGGLRFLVDLASVDARRARLGI